MDQKSQAAIGLSGIAKFTISAELVFHIIEAFADDEIFWFISRIIQIQIALYSLNANGGGPSDKKIQPLTYCWGRGKEDIKRNLKKTYLYNYILHKVYQVVALRLDIFVTCITTT